MFEVNNYNIYDIDKTIEKNFNTKTIKSLKMF